MNVKQLTIQLTGNPRRDVERLKTVVSDYHRENIRLGLALKQTQTRMSTLLRRVNNLDPAAEPPSGAKIVCFWDEGAKAYIAASEGYQRLGHGETPEEAVISLMVGIAVVKEVETAEIKPEIVIATPEEAKEISRLSDAIKTPTGRVLH